MPAAIAVRVPDGVKPAEVVGVDPGSGIATTEPELKRSDIEVGTDRRLDEVNECPVVRRHGHNSQRGGRSGRILHSLSVDRAVSRSPSKRWPRRPIGIAEGAPRSRLAGRQLDRPTIPAGPTRRCAILGARSARGRVSTLSASIARRSLQLGRAQAVPYGLAILIPLIATGLTFGIDRAVDGDTGFGIYFIAVAIVGWRGGLRPAVD